MAEKSVKIQIRSI